MAAETEPSPADERELKLSLYIDGELPASERAEIEAKIKNDPAWKADYQALADSELKIENVAAQDDDWHDADFTARVSSKIRTLPKPSGLRTADPAVGAGVPTSAGKQLRDEPPARVQSRTGNNPIRLALHLIFLLVAMGLFMWKFLFATPAAPAKDPDETSKHEAPIPARMLGVLLHGYVNNGVAAHEPEYAGWVNPKGMRADRETALLLNGGMLMLVGEDSTLRASGPEFQILEVAGGELFLPKATPSMRAQFSKIKLPTGVEIDTPQGGVEILQDQVIRAVGVTLTVKNAQRTLYIPDGFAAKADLSGVEAYDPRTIGARWSSIAYMASTSDKGANLPGPEFAAVWPQLHGDAGHTGVSPYKGPPALAPAVFLPWDFADSDNKSPEIKPSGPALALTRRDFYVAVTLEGNRTRLYAVSVSDQNLAGWKNLGPAINSASTIAPVLSPEGVIVIGTNGSAGGGSAVVQAWDSKLNKVAYTKELGTTLAGLTFARLNGKTQLLCATFKGLIALDEKGNESWTYSGVTDFAVPACVGPDGVIVALSKSGRIASLDADGKPISQTRMDPYGALRAPVFMRTENGGYFQTFTELGNEATVEANGKAGSVLAGRFQGAGRWMLSSRIFSQGNSVYFPLNEQQEVKLPFPGSVSSLAQDADGYIYATLGRTLFRLYPKNLTATPESAQAEKGTIIPGGIAVLPKRILVTTTEGLGIFE